MWNAEDVKYGVVPPAFCDLIDRGCGAGTVSETSDGSSEHSKIEGRLLNLNLAKRAFRWFHRAIGDPLNNKLRPSLCNRQKISTCCTLSRLVKTRLLKLGSYTSPLWRGIIFKCQ